MDIVWRSCQIANFIIFRIDFPFVLPMLMVYFCIQYLCSISVLSWMAIVATRKNSQILSLSDIKNEVIHSKMSSRMLSRHRFHLSVFGHFRRKISSNVRQKSSVQYTRSSSRSSRNSSRNSSMRISHSRSSEISGSSPAILGWRSSMRWNRHKTQLQK